MFTVMGSGPVTLLICSVIAAAIAYPYEQQVLTAQDPAYPHGYRNTEQRPITYRKRFHFFAAPEELDSLDEEIPEELLKENINVVVIKAPENNKATSTIARLAKTLAEEKTAIYVLNKEPDLKEITTQIERFKEQKITRPEVHFIKYKTAEEADLAARNIQVEYDSLRGPSEVEHQVTAALHSYVGLLDGRGVQEMELVSFYGRPIAHTFERSSPEGGDKGDGVGESLPASSFYLPPNGDAMNPAAITSFEDNTASEPEDAVGGTSSGVYLPPETEPETLTSSTTDAPLAETAPTATSRAPRVRSDFVKKVASTNVLNPRPEVIRKELVTSTTSPVVTTKKAGRGRSRYSITEKVTEEPTKSTRYTSTLADTPSSIIPNDSLDDLSLPNKYLPPSESKVRNKRLK